MPTKTQKKTVSFRSGVQALRLTRRPATRKMSDRGEWETTPGEAVQFSNGSFSSNDPELIKWLREHRLHDAVGQSGWFAEVGKEPGRPLPATEELLERIGTAAAKKDADGLAEIIVAERQTHSRPEVLIPATAALVALDKETPEPEPVPEHEKPREPYVTPDEKELKRRAKEQVKVESKTQDKPA